MRSTFTYTSGILAFTIYFVVVLIAFLIFNSDRENLVKINKDEKQKVIVAINMDKIESLDEKKVNNKPAPPIKIKSPKTDSVKQELPKQEKVVTNQAEEQKPNEPKVVNRETKKPTNDLKSKPEPVVATKIPEVNKVVKEIKTTNVNIKKETQKSQKESVVKNTNAKDLFSNIKTSSIDNKSNKISTKDIFNKINTKETTAMSSSISETTKTTTNGITKNTTGDGIKKQDGVPPAYINDIRKRLQAWPASDKYAGEVAKVNFSVKTSGAFEFAIIAKNTAFKDELVQYLKKLQTIGFDSHGGGRTWIIETTFKSGD